MAPGAAQAEAGLTSCEAFGDGMTVQVEDSDYEPNAVCAVWPEEQRIVRHSRMPNNQLATQVVASGEIRLDPPGIMMTVEEFYVD